MLPPLISDAKDKHGHPTFIFSVIRSRMLPSFIMDFCYKCWEIHSRMQQHEKNQHFFFFFFFFFLSKVGGAPYTRVRRIHATIRYMYQRIFITPTPLTSLRHCWKHTFLIHKLYSTQAQLWVGQRRCTPSYSLYVWSHFHYYTCMIYWKKNRFIIHVFI